MCMEQGNDCNMHNSVKLEPGCLNGTILRIRHPDGIIFTVTIRFSEFYARGLRKFDKLMFLVVIRQKTNCYCIPRAETVLGTKFQLYTLFH